jgi:hypothetical protein
MREHLTQLDLVFAIPKFHLPAHGFSCWSWYSLNFIPGSARVDGEAIERLWAATNPVATSTCEMATGARHDFLEEHWAMQNFKKLVALGDSLGKKLRTAVQGLQTHSKELADFSAANEPHIQGWLDMVNSYHEDPKSNADPYSVCARGTFYTHYLYTLLM